MTTLAARKPKKVIAEHLSTLRAYAKSVLVDHNSLSPSEEDDRARRMKEFLAIGSAFKLTQREMVLLVFKGLLAPRLGCGCPSCNARAGMRV